MTNFNVTVKHGFKYSWNPLNHLNLHLTRDVFDKRECKSLCYFGKEAEASSVHAVRISQRTQKVIGQILALLMQRSSLCLCQHLAQDKEFSLLRICFSFPYYFFALLLFSLEHSICLNIFFLLIFFPLLYFNKYISAV